MNAGHQAIINALLRPAEHWQNLQARYWSDGIDLSGADLRDGGLLDIGGRRLHGTTKFEGTIFPDGFIFRDTVFGDSVSFSKAIFKGSVDFAGAKFHGIATFDGCTFEGPAIFSRIDAYQQFSISGNAIFLALANFDSAKFQHPALFVGTQFKEARYKQALFLDVGTFDKAIVGGDANFSSTRFEGQAHFQGVVFRTGANFRSAEFGLAFFGGAIFQAEAVFTNANVSDLVSFPSCKLLGGVYLDGKEKGIPIGYVNLTDAIVTGAATFSNRRFVHGATFRGADFSVPPDFHGAELHQNTIFDCKNYGDYRDTNAEANFRTLKLAMHDQQSHREELLFFALEMHAHEVLERRGDIRWLYSVYRRLSNYGLEWKSPAKSLVLVFLLCWILYAVALSVSNGLDVGWDQGRLKFDVTVGVNAMLLSATQVLPFMTVFKESIAQVLSGLHANGLLYGFVVVLAISETIVSAALLFLLVLALRNLFRMR